MFAVSHIASVFICLLLLILYLSVRKICPFPSFLYHIFFSIITLISSFCIHKSLRYASHIRRVEGGEQCGVDIVKNSPWSKTAEAWATCKLSYVKERLADANHCICHHSTGSSRHFWGCSSIEGGSVADLSPAVNLIAEQLIFVSCWASEFGDTKPTALCLQQYTYYVCINQM